MELITVEVEPGHPGQVEVWAPGIEIPVRDRPLELKLARVAELGGVLLVVDGIATSLLQPGTGIEETIVTTRTPGGRAVVARVKVTNAVVVPA